VKQLALVLAVLVAVPALAQEIGTEITPTTPTSGVNTPPPNPPPEPPKSGGYVYKPKGAVEPAGSSSTGSSSGATFTGNKLSAANGDFGIRAGFGTSFTPGLGTGSGAAPVAAPNLGIAYFAADAFKLLIDLGFGMVLSSSTPFALNAVVGFDYMLRTPAEAMRPFFHFAALFTMAGGGSNIAVGFGAQLGFGAEYFFNPSFSLNGRLLIAVPMSVANGFIVGIFTLTPGVGATWYL
jgi:hypothetical protein